MSTDDRVQVGVAIIKDADRRLLWPFNSKWGLFALPMSKCRRGAQGQ